MIKLPKVELVTRHVIESYGGLYLIAKYCGLNNPIYKFKTPTFWTHGWRPDACIIHPFSVISDIYVHGKQNYNFNYLVARKKEEIYLLEQGYTNAKAIGLPIVYLPELDIKRISNTLLVMPVHSDHTIHNNWKFQEYVEIINKIKSKFDRVLICLHPMCVKDGYWINEFKQAGYEIVEGAIGNDQNALLRIQILLSSFEYVTTNGYGSHLVYASFLGAKVSIYGDYAEHSIEVYDYANDPYYQNNMNIVLNDFEISSKVYMKKMYPWLFCDPQDAIQNIEWGRYEVGYENKLTKEEVLELFGWKNFYWTPRGWKYWLSKNTSEFFKSKIRIILNLFK